MARRRNSSGNVLGLGNPSPAAMGERMRNYDNGTRARPRSSEESRRHRRMSEGADEVTPSATSPHHSSGATGIDMGAGGEGTDIE